MLRRALPCSVAVEPKLHAVSRDPVSMPVHPIRTYRCLGTSRPASDKISVTTVSCLKAVKY